MKRREFLKAAAMTAVGALAASCAQPTPQVIEKEVPVEKVVKETVVVEKEVAIEKVVTATPVTMKYKESPMLSGLVQAGKLPPVDERLPEDVRIVTPVEEVGQYGGTWHRLAVGPSDIRTPDRLMYNNIVRYNVDGSEVIPHVVKAWEISPDGKVFTFQLRKGMKWSDGEPYTADDLMFYFVDQLGNKELQPSFPTWLTLGGEPVKAAKVDDYTLTLSFVQPYGLFLAFLAGANGRFAALVPAHYAKQFHAAYADKAALESKTKAAGVEFWYQLYSNQVSSEAAHKNNTELPVIHAWVVTVPPPKQPVVLERNPYYWSVDTAGNQLPYIDRIEHMIVENAQMVNLRAMSGEVDMQLRHITFENYPLFQENKEKGDYRILEWPRGYITDAVIYPNINHKDPVKRAIMEDKRFRWALSLGINRQEIIDAMYLGMAEPNQISPLPTSVHYWEEQAKNLIEYDPDRANQLLDEMGLDKRDSDGYRLMSNGERLAFIYDYAPVFGSYADTIALLAAQWKKLGMEVTPKEVARQLHDELIANSEHEFAIWTGHAEFDPLIDPVHFLPAYRSGSKQYPAYAQWYDTRGKEGEEPPAGSDIRKTCDLYDQIKTTVDTEEQKRLFRQILELNKENLWCIGICTAPPEVVVVKNAFRNVPELAGSDWQLLTPGNAMTEQFFIRQS